MAKSPNFTSAENRQLRSTYRYCLKLGMDKFPNLPVPQLKTGMKKTGPYTINGWKNFSKHVLSKLPNNKAMTQVRPGRKLPGISAPL